MAQNRCNYLTPALPRKKWKPRNVPDLSTEAAELVWNLAPKAPATLAPPLLAGRSDGIGRWEGLNDLHIQFKPCFLQKEETEVCEG